jgi:hypothetical protein
MIGKPENNHPTVEVSRSDGDSTDFTQLAGDFLVVCVPEQPISAAINDGRFDSAGPVLSSRS